jgi:RNA polymerase sigma-70 factor (ECF subfamily)
VLDPKTERVSAAHEALDWVRALTAGPASDEAVGRLHALLLDTARFEVARRPSEALDVGESEAIALQAANAALEAVLTRLGEFRGDRRFTTWARKFALLEAAVAMRKRAWERRDLRVAPELVDGLDGALGEVLTPDEQRVFVALTLKGMPIDVLAEQESTTRAALYETLRIARRKLRRHLEARADLAPAAA